MEEKGDILKLEYHRGLFLVSLFKTIIMKLIYLRNYELCRDHMYVANGAIQDALSSKSSKPLDLFVCDYKTMFDGLDIKTTLNDLYDNEVKDDSFALIYKLYEKSNVAIKTPMGLTKRRRVEREIITQGYSLGPILASSSVDSFGKECYAQKKHLYWYRNLTPVSALTMIDDVFCISNCGPESTQIQEYINIKTASKKLQYAIDKTFCMHVGKTNPGYTCENSYIDSWRCDRSPNSYNEYYEGKVIAKHTFQTKYLGEVISSDGTNTANISNRKRRGFGTLKDIVNMLDKMCLGPYMYEKAVLLRDSMLVGTLLSCSAVWYNVVEVELGQLEQVDKALWCNLLEVARTVPYNLICLELGIEPLRYIIMRRRLM